MVSPHHGREGGPLAAAADLDGAPRGGDNDNDNDSNNNDNNNNDDMFYIL